MADISRNQGGYEAGSPSFTLGPNVVTFCNLCGNLFYTSEMGFRQWDLVSAACMWEFSTTSSDPVCQVSWFVMTLECGFLRSLRKLL